MTTKLATAKEWAHLGGAICATGSAILCLAHPVWNNDISWAVTIPVATGSMGVMALGVGEGGKSARRLAEQYSKKGAKVWEGFESLLGKHAAGFGRASIFAPLVVGGLAAVGLGNAMDDGLPLASAVAASLAAGTFVTAVQGIKQGIWDRMNNAPIIVSDDDTPGTIALAAAAPKVRSPRR